MMKRQTALASTFFEKFYLPMGAKTEVVSGLIYV